MTDPQENQSTPRHTDTPGKYIVIYGCLMLFAALQFVIAYSHVERPAMLAGMLLIAIAEAGLAVLFFMHLWAEKRGFLLFVVIFTGFVFLALQYGWTDSNRMNTGAPYSQPNSGVVSQ